MSEDLREEILDKTFIAMGQVPGIMSSWRNRGELPDDLRPALTLLDGDEVADERAFDRGRMAAAPNIIIMRPEIYIVMDLREPKNVDIGQDMNKFRREILRVILFSQVLRGLVGQNGEIRYEGCVTDMANGRLMQGQMLVRIAFKYPLNPGKLVGSTQT